MSFFYLVPVKGNLPIHLIETIVANRLDFLNSIYKNEVTGYNEYVIEGSVYDNVGHFMLRLVAGLYEHRVFQQFVYKAEVQLFKQRLAALSAYDIRCFAKKIVRTVKKYNNVSAYIEALQQLCERLMLKTMSQHMFSPTHSKECTLHAICLHFKLCLPFVAKRQVEISNGQAIISCGLWMQYLKIIFNTHLMNSSNSLDLELLRSDPRLQDIITNVICKKIDGIQIKINNKNILSADIDKYSKYFPPCMLNLHYNLRNRHRLSHDQRFYYSLFLKDIGMSIDEAINFWRSEYSKIPSGSNLCSHSWEKDEKKYLYGIRHMYGLEGGRKKYTSVSCSRIQSTTNACSEGGCPFKTFDYKNMTGLLQGKCKESQNFMSQIDEFKKNHLYTFACKYYLEQLERLDKNDCDIVNVQFTPVTFFKFASKSNNNEI